MQQSIRLLHLAACKTLVWFMLLMSQLLPVTWQHKHATQPARFLTKDSVISTELSLGMTAPEHFKQSGTGRVVQVHCQTHIVARWHVLGTLDAQLELRLQFKIGNLSIRLLHLAACKTLVWQNAPHVPTVTSYMAA